MVDLIKACVAGLFQNDQFVYSFLAFIMSFFPPLRRL